MVGFIDSRVFAESCWYVAEYDKETGGHVRDVAVPPTLAKALLQAIGVNAYQDCYVIVGDSLKVLSPWVHAIDTQNKTYQLECCRD